MKSHKDKEAVRILIAPTGNNIDSSHVEEITNYVWDGKIASNVSITSKPFDKNARVSEKQFAYHWLAWQQLLKQVYDDHPYWEDHQIYAYRGTIIRTTQRFYIEIYYKD